MLHLVKALAVPPAFLFAGMLVGLALKRRRPRTGRAVMAAMFGLLWLLSTPVVAAPFLWSLQRDPAVDLGADLTGAGRPEAIVVLGADTDRYAVELGGESVGPLALQRLRYGAALHRASGLPILVTGGLGRDARRPAGVSMKLVLENEFGVAVRWVEQESRTTAENASGSARLLNKAGVTHVYLVSHAWHLPRARAVFEAEGLQVTPAPTAFREPARYGLVDFLPSAKALRQSSLAWHEWLGRLWYSVR